MEKQYAVNIGDMTRDILLSQLLLAPFVKNRQIVNVEKGRLDGGAVLLECEEEKAKAIIDIIRKKYSKHAFRCYESANKKTWKRI